MEERLALSRGSAVNSCARRAGMTEALSRIEDYALIGNTFTAALVRKRGSIDWFCAPRFDAPACLAALLGTAENGHCP